MRVDGQASGLNGRVCGWANVWAGAIPPHELVGGRTSGQANGRTSRSVAPPPLSPPHRCVTPHRRRLTVTAAAALASPPPPLLPSRRRLRRCCPASPPPHCHLASPPLPLSPSRRHLRRRRPRVATSAAIAHASPLPPPSPSRRRRRHLAIRTSPAHSPVTPRPSSPRSHGLPADPLVYHAIPAPPWACAGGWAGGHAAGERTERVDERANGWAGVAADGKGYLDLRLQVWCHELVSVLAFLSICRLVGWVAVRCSGRAQGGLDAVWEEDAKPPNNAVTVTGCVCDMS